MSLLIIGHVDLSAVDSTPSCRCEAPIKVSLVAQMVKNLPVMQELHVSSLSWEDPLQKVMATDSIILAWRIPWTEESGRPQSMESQSQTWLTE